MTTVLMVGTRRETSSEKVRRGRAGQAGAGGRLAREWGGTSCVSSRLPGSQSQGGRSPAGDHQRSTTIVQCSSTEGVEGRRPPVRSRCGRPWLQDTPRGPWSALGWSSPLNKSLWGRSPHALVGDAHQSRMREGRQQDRNLSTWNRRCLGVVWLPCRLDGSSSSSASSGQLAMTRFTSCCGPAQGDYFFFPSHDTCVSGWHHLAAVGKQPTLILGGCPVLSCWWCRGGHGRVLLDRYLPMALS